MRFSVIIPMYQAFQTLPACLNGVSNQDYHDFEVIMVDSSPGLESVQWIRQHTSYRVIHLEEKTRSEKARNIAAAQAQGDILAFLDADCVPVTGWLAALDQAFLDRAAAACGPVTCFNRDLISVTAHIAKFWLWLPGRTIRQINQAPTANFAILRNLYVELGGLDESHLASADTGLGYRLEDSGKSIRIVPGAQVAHIHTIDWRDLVRERYHRGYEFGLMRIGQPRWSRGLSWIYLMIMLILPFINLTRKLAIGWSAGYGRYLPAAVPRLFILEWAWFCGQAHAHRQALWNDPIAQSGIGKS